MADTITYTVSVDGGDPVSTGTTRSFNVADLPYGDHEISVTGTCLHGNTSTDTKTIHVPGYGFTPSSSATSKPLFIPFIAKGAHLGKVRLWFKEARKGDDPNAYICTSKNSVAHHWRGSSDMSFIRPEVTLKGEDGPITAYMHEITFSNPSSYTMTVGNQYYFSFEVPYATGGLFGIPLVGELDTTQTCWECTCEPWQYQQAEVTGSKLADRQTLKVKMEIEYA